ncbi:MAG: hypothetical protein HC896_05440 [Bacteroidales bacterium]|nr:hypothetical protein [Bacteroidales bacterium]
MGKIWHYYQVHGLSVKSQIMLPHLVGIAPVSADVAICLGNVAENLHRPVKKAVLFEVATRQFLLKVPNIGSFLVENGNRITVGTNNGNSTSPDLLVYLYGPAFGAVLHQRGMLPLHASTVVDISGKAIVIAGRSGAGKSTLCHHLLQSGKYSFLSDDTTTIQFDRNNKALAWPGLQNNKLWHDALQKTNSFHSSLEKVRDNIEKYRFHYNGNTCNQASEIKTIIVLNSWNQPGIKVTKLGGMVRFNALRKNTYGSMYLIPGEAQRQLLSTVQGCRLTCWCTSWLDLPINTCCKKYSTKLKPYDRPTC